MRRPTQHFIIAFLVRELDLPLRTSSDAVLRALSGMYGFTVEDVHTLVQQQEGN